MKTKLNKLLCWLFGHNLYCKNKEVFLEYNSEINKTNHYYDYRCARCGKEF